LYARQQTHPGEAPFHRMAVSWRVAVDVGAWLEQIGL
jgi:hypothetical protein